MLRCFSCFAVEHHLQRVTPLSTTSENLQTGNEAPCSFTDINGAFVSLRIHKYVIWLFQPFHTMVRLGLIFHRSVHHRSCSMPSEPLQQAMSFQQLEVRRQTLCISDTQKCLWGLSLVSSKCDDLHFSFI